MDRSMLEPDRLADLAVYWGSRVLAAVVILVVAHFVAKAVKWALARGVDMLPGARHHNEVRATPADKNQTVGARLGSVGYWLVLLVGVIAALNVLELGGVVAPLNAMLYQFGEYIPRIIGAVVIFFVGYVLATLAKRVVESALAAADLDHWLDKLGLRRLTGANGLAKTVGSIVFVLIIIPVAIAALNTLGVAAISQPATNVLQEVLNAVPRVITAAILMTIAFAIARWVASLIEQILPSFGFDQTVRGMLGGGASTASADPEASAATSPEAGVASRAASASPSKVVANLVTAAILLFVAVEAARVLEFEAIALMLQEVLSLFSRILFGGVIILAGVAIGQFLSRMLQQGGGPSSGLASTIVRWAATALAVAIGLRFMGLANEIVILAFGLILGSAAVAAAIAFGVGGREPAQKMLERWTQRPPTQP